MIDNRKIFKNTIVLYFRMLLLMVISLYTSRLFLAILGVEDYGLYNIVGSIIVLFSFINNALSGATRRFINTELGKNNISSSIRVFSICITTHIFISIFIVLVGESIGLYILNHYLNIPSNRLYAANCVYQFSIIGACASILGSPLESVIISYERMKIYAYISIAEAIAKLLILYLLYIAPFDKLIVYSFAILVVNLLISIIKYIYCVNNFPICKYSFFFNKREYLPFLSFSGWSLFGQMAYIGATTGVNMIVNVFCGVVMNASIGIARQVNNVIYNCVSGFQSAFNPQLVQTYSSEKKEDHKLLLSRASKISYFLIFMCSYPVLINIQFLLNLWLSEVPPHTVALCKLMIVSSMVEAFGTPLWMSMQATGKVKIYQLVVSLINFLNLPLAYIALLIDSQIEIVFLINVMISFCLLIFRILYILPKINYSITDYVKTVLFPVLIITLVQYSIMTFVCNVLPSDNSALYFVNTSILSLLLSLLLIIFCGITKSERMILLSIIKSKIGWVKSK